MGSSFNPQILVEKLAKLNPSQASIETLSHWCIFHMNKAKQVVETWDRQFHCSPREQRLAFLYLANDILQNSRRKGSEFVGEFWKVLPGALRYVIENGDEAGRSSALRLINIWEERKVFGSRGQTLKDEIMGKHPESSDRNGKLVDLKLKQPAGSTLDKLISGYQGVHSGQVNEDVIVNKCRTAISCFEKAEKKADSNINSGQFCPPAFAVELQGQHAILRDSINQLTSIELSRAGLVSQLREALQEEESKLEQVRNQLQVAQSQLENANKVCKQLLHSSNVKLVAEENPKEASTSVVSKSFIPGDMDQSAPVMYRRQASFPEKINHIEEDPLKSEAAAVVEKLSASTSSAQMLSYVLSSLASEGVIGNSVKESSAEYQPEKRAKLDNDQPYIPTTQNPAQPPLSTFQNPESYQIATSGQQLTSNDPPPPPSSPPPLPPLPPLPPYSISQYLQTTGSINTTQYGYTMSQQQLPSLTGYPGVGTQMTGIVPFTVPASNSYQSYQGSDGSLYTQQSSMSMAPISRQ